ncbi:MAG TPA: universal stress protein [Polyangiales bacterium]|nr:universal stress protein [Polyangiales bacterium]
MSDAAYVILVALQFDETGDTALQEGCRIAQRVPGSELHLVHVVTPGIPGDDSASQSTQLARAPQMLREYVDRACRGTTLKIVAHVRTGSPLDVILEEASALGTDLIVLGTHHRKGLEKLMLGSVAQRVVRDARCSVMIATPKQYVASRETAEPPCPDCVAARAASKDPQAWCERHSRPGLRMHVYTPSEPPARQSVL